MSGSALANAAGLGSMQIKAMKEAGYDADFSACVIASSAILGPIIPPSVIMIVYGITTGVPISKLFIGAIVPGVIFSAVYFAMVFYYARKNNYPKSEGFRWRELWNSFKDSVWALLAPVIILGGIFSGVFTPTESGAIASFYALLISLFVYKEIKIRDIPRVLYECGMTTGVILFIVATASAFGWCLTFARIPQSVANVLSATISNKLLLLLIFTVIYLFLGTIMEATPIVITTIPIFLPVCQAMGIDLVFFGVYVGILMAVGTITPPVGTAMFVICKNTGMTIEHFTKIMLPWFACIVCCILLLMFFPQIVLFLPSLLS